MTLDLVIPGFAVLCSIQTAPDGRGYICAFAVPARDDADARARATAHVPLEPGDTLQIEDSRPLTRAEADGLVGIRPLGPRVPIPAEGV